MDIGSHPEAWPMPALDGTMQRTSHCQALMRTMHVDMYNDADSHVEAE